MSKKKSKFERFIDFLKEGEFKIHIDNPEFRPGEGYGPPRYIEWDISTVINHFKKVIKE